jgi:hydroxymethylpyrimidine pyrophosphatase-like HAD family hydrolase
MTRRTYVIDIDGTILPQNTSDPIAQWRGEPDELLPGVVDFFAKAERAGDCVVLFTARRESCRPRLEATLQRLGLFWDALVMGVGNGPRFLINDTPDGELKASAVKVLRNTGLSGILGVQS